MVKPNTKKAGFLKHIIVTDMSVVPDELDRNRGATRKGYGLFAGLTPSMYNLWILTRLERIKIECRQL